MTICFEFCYNLDQFYWQQNEYHKLCINKHDLKIYIYKIETKNKKLSENFIFIILLILNTL